MAIVPASQENTAVNTSGGAYSAYPFADPIFTSMTVQQYYTASGVVSAAQMFDVVLPKEEAPAETDAEAGVGHMKAGK